MIDCSFGVPTSALNRCERFRHNTRQLTILLRDLDSHSSILTGIMIDSSDRCHDRTSWPVFRHAYLKAFKCV